MNFVVQLKRTAGSRTVITEERGGFSDFIVTMLSLEVP
jgi:hypothetical protein